MRLYNSSQVNITNLTLCELKHFFQSINNTNIKIKYHSDAIKHFINRINYNKVSNISFSDQERYLITSILEYIFESKENFNIYGTEQFRFNFINMIRKDKELIKRTRFVNVKYGPISLYLLTGSNTKFAEKTRFEYGIEYFKFQGYNQDYYERYSYENGKWKSFKNGKIIILTDNLDYFRIASNYIEVLYHFIIIDRLYLHNDINCYLKTIFIRLLDVKQLADIKIIK